MKTAELQKKLVAAARQQASDERVPYAFEKRVSALIAARVVADSWAVWSQGLWRAAATCVAVALIAGAVSFFLPASSDGVDDLSQDFENTLLASADQPDIAAMP